MQATATTLLVTYNDNTTKEVPLGPKEYVAFERQYNLSITVLGDPEKVRVEYMYFLAWSALSRRGEDQSIFDDFLEHVAAVEAVEEPPLAKSPSPIS